MSSASIVPAGLLTRPFTWRQEFFFASLPMVVFALDTVDAGTHPLEMIGLPGLLARYTTNPSAQGSCPAATILRMLDHGAGNPGGLVAAMLAFYRCHSHGNGCARPILERLLDGHPAPPAAFPAAFPAALPREWIVDAAPVWRQPEWVDQAIQFVLLMDDPPYLVLVQLMRLRRAPADPSRHPLVLCVDQIVRRHARWETVYDAMRAGLYACLLVFLKFANRFQVREAVPYALRRVAQWKIVEPRRSPTAVYLRQSLFRQLLDRTGVHPDAAPGSGPPALVYEAHNIYVLGARDLGCIGELLRRGADPSTNWPGFGRSFMVQMDMLILIWEMAVGGQEDFVDDPIGGVYWIRRCLTDHQAQLTPGQLQAVERCGGFAS